MNKKISKVIAGKKFTKDTLLHIIKEIYTNYSNLESDHKSFSVTLQCANYETLEFNDIDFNDRHSDILDTKKIHQIIVSFIDYRNRKKICFTIIEGDDRYGNNLSIEGDDIDWVNTTEIKLNDLLEVVEPRKNYFHKYSKILFHFTSINFGFLVLRVIIVLLDKFGYTSSSSSSDDNPLTFLIRKFIEIFPPLRYIILIFGSWLIGILMMAWLFDKIETLFESVFPSIEFDFGPMYLRKPRKLRKAIAALFTLVVLPLLLQLIMLI